MKKIYILWMVMLAALLAACGGGGVTAPPTPQLLTENIATGSVSFKYPTGWYVNNVAEQITIANSQAAAEANTPGAGQFQARMVVGPISAVSGLAAESTPIDVITTFKNALTTQGVTFSDPKAVTIGTYSAAQVDGSSIDGQGVVLAVNLGNGNYNIVSATSSPNEMPLFEPTLYAILETVTYTPPGQTPNATQESSG